MNVYFRKKNSFSYERLTYKSHLYGHISIISFYIFGKLRLDDGETEKGSSLS